MPMENVQIFPNQSHQIPLYPNQLKFHQQVQYLCLDIVKLTAKELVTNVTQPQMIPKFAAMTVVYIQQLTDQLLHLSKLHHQELFLHYQVVILVPVEDLGINAVRENMVVGMMVVQTSDWEDHLISQYQYLQNL